MAEAPRQRSTATRPSGWVLLLGLMVIALIIAAISKGCGGSDGGSPASQSPTTTSSTVPTSDAVRVIAQINAQIQETGVKFLTGKAELTTESKTTLDQVALILQQSPTVRAEVRGFTDNQGDAAKNLQLSQQRAEAVVAYLVGRGIAQARLTAKGLGEENPAFSNDTEEGRAKNRRVEFQLP